MKKLTIFFLSATLGASVFVNSVNAANDIKDLIPCPEFLTTYNSNGYLSCNTFDPWEERKDRGWRDWTGEKKGSPAWFCTLKKVMYALGKKPCDDCYSMMEPEDPRIPKGTKFVYKCK